MKAVIPVAGYATRLFPLTVDQPKALIEIDGRSILNIFFDKLQNLEVFSEVVLVSNDKFYQAFVNWSNEQDYDFTIKVLNDGTTSNEDRLGAVGDFVLGLQETGDDEHVLISAGDGIFEDNFANFLDAFEDLGQSIIATKELPIEQCHRFGIAEVDDTGKVVSFEEKPEQPKSPLVGIMTYIIHKDTIKHLHEGYQQWDQEGEMNAGEIIRYLVSKDVPVYTYQIDGAWFDIGTHEQLAEARAHFAKAAVAA